MASPNLDKLKIVKTVPFAGDLLSVAHVPQSDRLWIGAFDHKLYSLDFAAPKPQLVGYTGHTSYVSGVVVAGRELISAGWDRKLIWWNTETKKPARIIEAHQALDSPVGLQHSQATACHGLR